MTIKHKLSQKAISIFVCIALLLSYLPFSVINAGAASLPLSGISKVTDTSTVNGWKDIFTETSTENAGGVWVDKSVFSTVDDFLDYGKGGTAEDESSNTNYHLSMSDQNNFLISLSAIASNKQVMGYSTIPTDTVFVLDMSSSMYRSNSIGDLADATNSAIKQLTSLNHNNRISVILYSGSGHTTVLLPLDKYTPNSQNNFITHNGTNNRTATSITVLDGVENSNGTNMRQTESYNNGTFTQDGIYAGMKQLLAADPVVAEGIQAGVERMPIMVVMTDGEPSHSTSVFSGNDSAQAGLTQNNGNNYDACDFVQFVNQLTAAYAKYKVETNYTGHDMLLYTLGLGVTDAEVPTLQPSNSNSTIVGYWNEILKGNRVTENCSYNIRRYVDPNAAVNAAFMAALDGEDGQRYRFYSDGYYHSDLGELGSAFDDIVDEIILQSKYYPTYVEGSNINYGGYLSMVDTLGKYMEVKDMKHVQIGSQPFYGRNAARELSSITSLNNLNEIQTNLVKAVTDRLNVNENTALQVILASQTYNNLYFTDNTDFNNSICWYGKYADAVKGAEFVAVWNGNGDSNVPAEANCKIQSYYFYGAGEATDGQIRIGDMRYIEVDVVTFISTGETKVRVRIPASLIPLITYEVMLNGDTLDSDAESITVTGATAPMRLVYEVGLKDTINSLNVGDLEGVTKNADGEYEFYTNKWDYAGGNINIGVTPPQEVGNSYAYFEPSAENEYLYYQNDTPVYVKDGDNYVEYVGTTHPKDVTGTTFYGQRFHYTKPAAGGTSEPVITYHMFDEAHLEHIVPALGSATSWIIPKGSHFMDNGDTISIYKDSDGGATNTYKTSSTYYVMHTYESSTDTSIYNMQVALGNNGKLSMMAEQGIRLQKIVPENAGLDAATEYEFTIKPAEGSGITLSDNYNLYLADAIDNDGTGGAVANGTAQKDGNSLIVKLKGNQTLYIAGLPEGEYTVTEKLGASYIVSAIGATATNSNSTTAIVNDDTFTTTSFTNIARGTGNLTIAKEITHSYGTAYIIPNTLEFEMTVSLTLNGAPISGDFTALQTKDNTVEKITAENGKFTVYLFNEDEIEIFGLPQGTVATVTETAKTGFTPTYWENGVVDGEIDGQVEIAENHTSSVLVVNDYEPTNTLENPIITLTVNKNLTGRDWKNDDSFAFELQKWNGSAWETVKLSGDTLGGRKTINGSMTDKKLDFTNEIKSEIYSTIGTYYYRVVEIEPESGIFGISYDKALHGFVVEVTDTDMNGTLEIKVVETAQTTSPEKVSVTGDTTNGYNVTANFANIYDVDETSIAIEINKTVKNDSGSPLATLAGFEFEIEEINSQKQFIKQLPNFDETSSTGTTRTTINFTNEGTYYYAIKELGVDNNIWKYDKDTEYVTVVVEGNSNGGTDYLVATAYSGIITDFTGITGSNTVAFVFENTYTPARASLNLNVTKTLNGRNMKADEFTFTVAPYDNDFDKNPIIVLSGDNYVPVTINLTADNGAANNGVKSAVTFPTMYFDKVGTYFYNVSEAPTDKEGVRADDNTYRVVVTVTDTDGVLSANYHVINIEGTEIPFVNTYTPNSVPYAVSGEKFIDGRTLRNEEFTFVLVESDVNGEEIENAKSWTAKNNITGDYIGTFTFPEISYNAVGIYYYAVTEQQGITGHGITYSEEKYVVAVDVTYSNDTGEFTVDSSIVKVSEQTKPTVDTIEFTNTYKAAATFIEISGLKNLTGNRSIWADAFAFELYKTDSADSYESDQLLLSVKNDGEGKFKFSDPDNTLKVTEAGTYYFVVKENIPDEKMKGVTYDTALYNISVVVTDNGNGQLVANNPVISRKTNVTPEVVTALAFYNAYQAEDTTLVLSGIKKLEGRTLSDNEFTFLLKETDEQFAVFNEEEAKYAKNMADGTFAFEEITYREIGTYYYVIYEDSTDKLDNVQYDSTKYYVTVEVKENEDVFGELIASYTVKTSLDATENAESIIFTNTYTPPTEDIPKSPDTGDSLNLALWFAIFFVSGSILIGTSVYGRKKEKT